MGESPAVASGSLTKVICVAGFESVAFDSFVGGESVVKRRDTSRHRTTRRAAALPGIRVPGTGASPEAQSRWKNRASSRLFSLVPL
jgi:hypothetical protein